MSRPLLRVACPAGHMLARIVAVRGVGPVVMGDRTIKISSRTSYTMDEDGEVYTVDAGRSGSGLHRRTREPVPLTALGAFRCRCPCDPEPVPGWWLRDRLTDGRRDVVWDWNAML